MVFDEMGERNKYMGCFREILGASNGIGSETARVLAMLRVRVVMGVWNIAAGKDVKETIPKENSSAKVDVMELYLSSMASVRQFASKFDNNVGVMSCPFMLSHDNIEMQFAKNHLGLQHDSFQEKASTSNMTLVSHYVGYLEKGQIPTKIGLFGKIQRY
ncbi:hypothetical protein C5167_020936 [Papaver somniferum]|uniref:Uncharacterized protein n=1 Tax=Papaver somniferum TaxID=3469 RepID=A0A4Y7IXN8_PAPSO|nr:hypothetical protein C5167_020936 [Papaver somniferum]